MRLRSEYMVGGQIREKEPRGEMRPVARDVGQAARICSIWVCSRHPILGHGLQSSLSQNYRILALEENLKRVFSQCHHFLKMNDLES